MKHIGLHRVFLLGISFSWSIVFHSEPLSAAPTGLDLSSSSWKFKTGDDPSWSERAVNVSDWRSIEVGTSWEEQGVEDYNGFAWYRLGFKVPKDWKNRPDLKKRGALLLDLGWIDDVDQTWFNGVEVGQTGEFPPNFELAYRERRKYVIPESAINWTDKNVIAVRVYDGSGRGGMYSGDCRLAIADWSDLVTMDFDLGDGDGIYNGGDPVKLRLNLRNRSKRAVGGSVEWKLKTADGRAVTKVQARLSVSGMAEGTSSASFPIREPGFHVVTAEFGSNEREIEVSKSMLIGYKPEEIVSLLTKEDDFNAFWENTLEQLADITPEFELTRTPERDSETHEVYEVKMKSLGGVRVGGWYEKPKGNGKHPALLRVPGYGGNMWPTGTSDQMAVFSFNVRGHGNSQADVAGQPENFWIRGLDAPEGYYYQGAYADCVRAVDFLVSRPEVDAARIAVTGGSQGGGLSLATAALDQRISLCAPDIAFLCDWKRYFAITDWPEVNEWIAAKETRSWSSTLRTMSYFDALNLANRIQCPVFFGIGLQDDVCPAATIFAVYNRIKTEKEFRVYPNTKHWVPKEHWDERDQWIRSGFGIQ